jgi:hypothetical protein
MAELRGFSEFGLSTIETLTHGEIDSTPVAVPTFSNEFWTSKQRAAHSLHELSYRACFKPQLPRFFIERLTGPGDSVYDPFMGRGTTLIEAALLGRCPAGCDINPLSAAAVRPRLAPPSLQAVSGRLDTIDLGDYDEYPEDFLVFYHEDTLARICALKKYLRMRQVKGAYDEVDDWIQMVALNRLTGHSPGFFSVYTMPPNQAVSIESQKKINERRNQVPPRRDVVEIIKKKTRSLLSGYDWSARHQLVMNMKNRPLLLTGDAEKTPKIRSNSVHLVVTSPPFLDIIDYASDNWLRCWFIGVDAGLVPISILRKPGEWEEKMRRVFLELKRVLVPGGHTAFEVGEVRKGRVKLEENVIKAAVHAGLEPVLVLINSQCFTKTAHCWGVDNNTGGTNTNRIVLLRKPV